MFGKKLDIVFNTTSNFMAIYDTVKHQVICVNPAMKQRSGLLENSKIDVIYSSENNIYITMDGIPCSVSIVYKNSGGIALADLWPAHSKRWTQSSNLLRLTDMASDGVFEQYPLVGFEYMSERFWTMMGYSQSEFEELPGSWMKLMHPDDLKKTNIEIEQHIKSNGTIPFNCKVRYNHKDGNEIVILCRASVVEWLPDGRPWYILGTHTDITEIVKKDSIEAKTYISRMSHEIRSPICTIINECELLGSNSRTNTILDSCKQLVALIDSLLLNIGKTKDTFKLNLSKENITDICVKCVNRHNLEAKRRGIKIRTMLDHNPQYVMVDLCRFNQVLDNLIGNSLKYSKKGVILLDTEYDTESQICSVRVTDDGIGIDPIFHTSVFKELVQCDDSARGAGIGLTLCRKLAMKMNGNVTIEKSSLGNGTTMLFLSHLPRVENECEDEREKPEESSKLENSDFRILIVDDMEVNREILQRKLLKLKPNFSIMGLNIVTPIEAVDGNDAVNKFIENNGNFNLILMDCQMPIMNGFEATIKIHELCSQMSLKKVPVVAITASVCPYIKNKCVLNGMKYVVTKPYSEIDLLASIQCAFISQ